MKLIRTRQLYQLRSLKNQVLKGMLVSRISCLKKLKGEAEMRITRSMGFSSQK